MLRPDGSELRLAERRGAESAPVRHRQRVVSAEECLAEEQWNRMEQQPHMAWGEGPVPRCATWIWRRCLRGR